MSVSLLSDVLQLTIVKNVAISSLTMDACCNIKIIKSVKRETVVRISVLRYE